MHIHDTVRLAGTDDIPDLFWFLMHGYHADEGWGMGWSVSPKKLLAHIQVCCSQQDGVAGIIDGHKGIIGSIGIEVYNPWYSDDDYLSQAWLYILPEHRMGTRHAEALFDFQDWYKAEMEKRLGHTLLLESAVTSKERLDAKMRLFRRRAGKQVGGVFWDGEVAQKPQP